MAGVTGGGETCRLVVGVRSVVVIRHVTGAASCAGQVVVAVDVALRARERGVLSGEWKPRARVIELPISPRIGVVTILASSRYSGRLVIGIGGALIVLQMAGHTGGIGDVVVAVDVALRARSFGM